PTLNPHPTRHAVPSTTLFRSAAQYFPECRLGELLHLHEPLRGDARLHNGVGALRVTESCGVLFFLHEQTIFLQLINGFLSCGEADRKSTRLNSSHVKNSYAVV